MDVHVKVKKPLARRCRCGMTFDASGCLMQVTPEEYAVLKADPWLDVAIMDPEDTELSPDPQPSPAVSAQAAPTPESDALDACGPPVFADDWPQADDQGEGDQPPAYDVERVATALDQASREADSYLAVRLAVPLDTTAGVPQPLRAFVCDMARYHLTAGFGMQVPEDVEARYKAALAWLKDVAKGAAEIVVPTPPDAPEPQPPETGVEFAPGCHDRFF